MAKKKTKKEFKISFHLVFLILVILFLIWGLNKFLTYGNRVKSQYDPNASNEGFDIEVLDNMKPIYASPEDMPPDDGIRTILFLGNSPLSDDKYSPDGLANMIGDMTGAKIYDCSIPGSMQSVHSIELEATEYPMDAFSLYWLSLLATGDRLVIQDNALKVMGNSAPIEAYDAYDTLTSLDFNDVDVICIMYDGTDYLEGQKLIDNDKPEDITTFYGAMNSSLALLQAKYPHIRYIVMSPAYCYAIDENGEYYNSDFAKVDGTPYSEYCVMMERAAYINYASFVDNIYGTINEYNAEEYLRDNIHLNLEGRKKMAERFIYALTFYD